MKAKNHRTHVSNVLVIGSGGAGLRAAIEAKKSGVEVTVIGKRKKEDVHTVLAAGGINASFGNVDSKDNWKQHFADTMIEGYNLSEPRMVELMAKEAPGLVSEIDEWGANFAKLENGKLDQRYFGAHTYRRTCYSGDYTGRSILKTLIKKANELKIPIHDSQYVTELLVHNNICFGAMTFNINNGERTVFIADSTIIAAGGHTRIWRKSSSRRNENSGDAFYLALKAGCKLKDMELVQFHPTGMVVPEEISGTLVTEAVRGEGGRLINGKGERFMANYDKQRLELSTRDRVAMANYLEISEGRASKNGGVYLDISHKSKEFIIKKLPRMYRQFLDTLMIDISKTPMEVAPTAHYSMGGIIVDPDTHNTGVDGLFAAGECTSGLHGANRLGGNSLAEILIFGKRAGKYAAERSLSLDVQYRSRDIIKKAHKKIDFLLKSGDHVARPLQRELRNIMWEKCGVVRDEIKLQEGLKMIDRLKKLSKSLDVRPDSEGYEDLMLAFDLEGSIMAAEATILGALKRKESRGSHQRSDFKEVRKEQELNYVISLGNNKKLKIQSEKLKTINPELKTMIESTREIKDFKGLLLE
ncbi:MAG: succinate dehydrogenase [Saprospirales bacterium]|nr:succinate dehydrogenase [Saprospirales bacterium]|tara:strand:- start:1471 stop:3225 length:1755 start_codon:yes stop_codon:yes gene_type:complete